MNWRYRAILFFFVIFFAAVVVRLFYWQVVRAEELADIGRAQYGTQIKLTPLRGEIRTSDGFAIAANKISYLLYANPKDMKEKEKVSMLLSPIINEDIASISALLSLDKFWVPLKNQVDEDTKEKIEKLDLTGLGFEDRPLRYYPEASTAAQLLGFVGKDSEGENTGYFGLEGYYDRQLRGKTEYAIQIHDAFGRPILAKLQDNTNDAQGRSINLHIDRAIQYLTDQELQQGVQKYGADGGTVIVMDPKTGGILALSAYPSFDPRDYADYDESLYKDPVITDTYEPGSTFKPLIMSAAIEEGLIKPDTICTICSGPVSIGGYKIRTWDDNYFPNSTMTEVIQHSDNTGMVFVSEKLKLNGMLKYLDKFGFGQLTGIDLQGEVAPELRAREDWHPIDVATASFGQGISVTPIELITAFTAIANGGKRMEPQVVASVETPDGEVIPIQPKVLDQPISPATAKIMTEIMVNAVDNGEAKWAKPKGYRIAGKTGTAQIPIEGVYDPNKTIASFIGFAPAEDPKFLMLVTYDKPTTSIYGAETAAPTFFDIAKKLLNYYGIAPTP